MITIEYCEHCDYIVTECRCLWANPEPELPFAAMEHEPWIMLGALHVLSKGL